jgi:hypothetical protein
MLISITCVTRDGRVRITVSEPEVEAVNPPPRPETIVPTEVPPELSVKPAGSFTDIFPSAGNSSGAVNETVTFPLSPATKEAGITEDEEIAPIGDTIVTAGTAEYVSIATDPDVCVCMVKVPVAPSVIGFLTCENVRDKSPSALLPPLRVTVKTFAPAVVYVKVPPIVLEVAVVTLPLLKVNPGGKVTTILPFEGRALTVVKETKTLPDAPAIKEAGVTK